MTREVETEQEIRLELYRALIAAVDHLEGEVRLIALAAIAKAEGRGGLAAARARNTGRIGTFGLAVGAACAVSLGIAGQKRTALMCPFISGRLTASPNQLHSRRIAHAVGDWMTLFEF
jgi:hypothetical protein